MVLGTMHDKIKMVFCRCNIQGSVVSANVHINEKCELKDCIVGAEQNLQANSEYSICFYYYSLSLPYGSCTNVQRSVQSQGQMLVVFLLLVFF